MINKHLNWKICLYNVIDKIVRDIREVFFYISTRNLRIKKHKYDELCISLSRKHHARCTSSLLHAMSTCHRKIWPNLQNTHIHTKYFLKFFYKPLNFTNRNNFWSFWKMIISENYSLLRLTFPYFDISLEENSNFKSRTIPMHH